MQFIKRKFGNASKFLWALAVIIPVLTLMQTTQPAYAFGPTCTVASSGANYSTIQAAASDLNCSTISVAAGTFSEHVIITRTLTINGAGAGSTIVDGTNSGTVFSLSVNSLVTLNALTITGGKAADGSSGGFPGGDGSSGGGIFNNGTLTLTNSTLNGNSAGNGGNGGIGVGAGAAGGNAGNGGSGGGIFNTGTLTVISSTFTSNQAGTGGAGGSGFVSGSLFTTSSKGGAGGSGGAIFNSGTLSVTSSIVGGNNAGNGGAGGNGVDNNTQASDGGNGGNGGTGGGIYSNASQFAISSSTFSGNSSGSGGNGGDADPISFNGGRGGNGGNGGNGGGVNNDGALVASNNTFNNNSSASGGNGGFGSFGPNGSNGFGGSGGGFANSQTLSVTNSTLSANTSSVAGGGIYNYYSAALNVNASTILSNTASLSGGGIYLDNPGSLNLSNSTLSGNTSPNGGAIYSVGYLNVTNSTLAGNNQGILNQFAQPFTLRNTIVANNAGGNCAGFITDAGGNLQYNPNTGCGSITAGDPKLAVLANYGGSTQTMALGAGSAAIDLGIGATCAASIGSPNFGADGLDQRGLPRRVTSTPQLCDSGAFEAQPATIAVVAGTPQSAAITTVFTQTLQAIVKDSFNNILGGAVVTFTPPASGASIAAGSATTNISGTVSFIATANGSAGGPYNVAASPTGVSPVNFSLTNLKAATLTSLTSAPNPSLFGRTLNITATVEVAPPIPGLPTGTATFYEVTTLSPSRTQRAPQSVVPLVNGQAVFTTTTLSVGTHTIKADYSGDNNLYPSTAAALTQVVNGITLYYYFPFVVR